ncbi:receptor-interacting serine/threonine-protein kinase 1 [Cephus cinctus]|uniref:Receptor-interacting serine/threonine-protein kinase 1 n=1 Tax=Cephus cinctus TaxID=211228 RepID=A0AAJ7FCB5_CEPCN|nr:receptor-interacting serine/threonine-protein kinase 1 [Cephus cinctus]XP_015584806.1 receptor-interacting serine/threonine-protein kinase 1 [Cephus cinctus]XP_015584807.1 receptor-interacting serine/threonine-protein kinase 1 [Cephus cinctus]XP_015584808.1 receptor-interacting serine/threonine-protein kinase 1 [Cephus cinctus]
MPILSEMSQRFINLTTDAKPDPPRIVVEDEGYKLGLSSPETKINSAPVTPDIENGAKDIPEVIRRQKSAPEPTTSDSEFPKSPKIGHSSTAGFEFRSKSPRGKTKPKYKIPQSANVVNYNIVNSKGVTIGSRTSITYNNLNQFNKNTTVTPKSSTMKAKTKPMPESVEELSMCKEQINLDDMFLIKTHIGHGWRDVARRLGYSEGQIDQFEENHMVKGIDQVIYQVLLDWKQTNTKDARLGDLICIIWSCQEYDCVERLAAARKKPS